MASSRMLRVFVLTVCLFGVLSTAQATPPVASEAPRPIPRNVQGKMLGYGALAGSGGLLLSVGFGFLAYAAGDDPKGHADDLDGRAIMGFIVGSATTVVTVPLATGLTVHAVGKRAGYRGGGAATGFGAVLGMGVGAGAVLIGLAAFDFETRLAPTIAVGSVLGVLSVSGFSLLGYRASDRVRTRLLPSASPTHVGLAAHGTF